MKGARQESPRERQVVRRPWTALARQIAGTVVLGIAALAPATAAAADRAANILMLYSNGRLLPANVEAERGLRETFARAPERGIAVFDEFLDSPRFGGPDFERTMAAYLREKYASRPPDVVVAGGGEALAFLLANRDTLFPRARIVHMGVEARDLAALPVGDVPIVGAPVVFDFAATIDLGLRLHPEATRLVIVTGATAPDRRWEAELRAIAAGLPRSVAVEFLAGLPTSDVAQRLRHLGDDAVVFTPGYFGDGAGRAYAPREAALAMVAASTAPVYGPFDPFIGTGVVGGVMPRFTAIGAGAGAAVLAVLDGVPPVAAARAAANVNVPAVDWRQLQRWHIDESLLPPGTSLRLREPTLFEAHRTEVIVACAVVLLQAALIFGLLLERRRRQLAEQSVQAQRLELAHASRLAVAGELTGSIAHEINQPLGAILSNTEAAGLMLESGTLQHDELRGILADIRRDDLRASEVIRRLRALLSRHDIERERFDVNDVVRDVEAMLQGEARRRGVALHVQPARSAATVLGDPIQIQQVVINLVLNAMDASGDVAGDRRSVHVTVARRGAGIVVEVRDSGPGIPPENLPKLFDSFFSTKRTGMGLGLSIARTLVEAHGGRIVAANGAVGAVFEIELPAADEAVGARESATA